MTKGSNRSERKGLHESSECMLSDQKTGNRAAGGKVKDVEILFWTPVQSSGIVFKIFIYKIRLQYLHFLLGFAT